MILKIGNKKFERFNDLSVKLSYDGVASTFSFSLYFDPKNEEHRLLFKPCQYTACTVEYDGKKLITGTMLSPVFSSTALPELVNWSGYSVTGVLGDCSIPLSAYPLQSNKLNLKEITEKILKPYGLKLVVDATVSDKVKKNYHNSTGGESQTAVAYITELANQQHVIVSHDQNGNVLLTEANTKQLPKFHFDGGNTTDIRLQVDGQKMHSEIRVQRDHSKNGNSAGSATIKNPYVKEFRPLVIKITTGNDTTPEQAARNRLSEELKAVAVMIDIAGWEVNGELVTPNIMITAQKDEAFLYEKTKLFVESVEFTDDPVSKRATLTCYLPEVYNSDPVKNIFDA